MSTTHANASLGPSPATSENETKMEALSVGSSDANDPLLTHKKKQKPQIKLTSNLVLLFIIIVLLVAAVIGIWTIYFIHIHEKASETYNDGPPGLFGEWPVYGGSLTNQQIPPNDINITTSNIQNISLKCSYTSENGQSFDGYIVIDDNNNAYFSDYSGYITCVNLDTCNEVWRKSIARLLGYNTNIVQKIVSRNSVTLYIDNATRRKSVLLATPNKRRQSYGYPDADPCWLLSLDARTGNLIWKIDLSSDNRKETYLCHAHGFIVDNDGIYAYGGLSVFAWLTSDINQNIHFNQFKGRLIKIDLRTREIADEFYTIPKNKNDEILQLNESTRGYIGGGIWNFPAMIDDYIVFGSGDLATYPEYINDCFNGNDLSNSYPFNPCNEDKSNDSYWKCLEDDILIDSLIVLNIHTFELIFAVRLQGVDAWNYACELPDKPEPCPAHEGTDSDLAAVSVQRGEIDGVYYAFAHQKSGMFYMVEIPSGEVLISKKLGPWSSTGGADSFSLAISTLHNIAITTVTGGFTTVDDSQRYKYRTADNHIICETGSIHAIDLNTGYTLYQIVNPFGRSTFINDSECLNNVYNEYIDHSLMNGSLCERAYDGSDMLFANETCMNPLQCVIYPDIIDIINDEPVSFSQHRGKFYGGITIANDMIFVPSISGDIFIHNLLNGSYIHRLTCPITSNNNRPAIGGGVTVVGDRIVFYCGRRIQSRKTGSSQEGNELISMQLNLTGDYY